MYSSYTAAALALRAAKPSSSSYAHSSYHHHHHGDGECHHQHQELHPPNPRVAPRFMLDGYLLRHSAHLLLSARLRPAPPPHPLPHCCRRRVTARCCGCRNGGGGGCSSVVGHVSWRLDPRCGAGRSSDLGAVCRRVEAGECRCGSGGGRLDVGARCGRRGAPRLVGRAVRQEVWEYEGGEWPRTSCSTECHADWEEEEEEDCGLLTQWEAPRRFRLSTRRWEEDDGDRCSRDCHRRKGARSDYYGEDEYSGRRRERRNMNEGHGRFRDSDQRRWEQRDHHDDDDYLEFRRWKEWRDRRDSDFDDSVSRRGVEARRYSEDDRKYDQRRTKRDFGYDDAVDVRREGAGRYTENNQRSDWRTEKREYGVDDEVDVRRDGRHYRNNDQRYAKRQQHIRDDREEEDVSLLESRRWDDEEYEYDDRDIAERRYYSGRRSQKSARASALQEDESNRASSSRNTVDTRVARNEENSSSRVRWHDNVDRRAEQTYEDRDQRYSSSVSRSYDEKHHVNHDDAQLARVRDSRIGTRDVRVINEDDANLASSSKNTTISKHHSTVDQKSIARKGDSRKSSQKIMELSEVRGTNTEHDSRTQSYHQEDRERYINNRSSSLQSSANMVSDTRTQLDQHDKVDQQVVALTGSRRRSEKLTDIKMDSSCDVSRTSLTQKNYDEVNQTDIDDRATSVHNITHITRDKKRYVNEQVIHETDIDVQNVTQVDVSKVRASDIITSRNSQNHLETRSDVANNQLIQIHANSSPMIRVPQSHLEAGLHNRVYVTSATDIANTSVEKPEQFEFTKASNTAIASTSESHMQTRIDDQLQSSSAVNTVGSAQEQIDLTKIRTSDSTVSSSSQGLDTRGNQVSITSATNFIDGTRENPDKSDQEMTQVSNIARNDQDRSKFDGLSQDPREMLARLKETGRLMQHNMGLNWQQEGSSRISNDTDIATLEIQSTGDDSSMVTADVQKRPMIMRNSEQEGRSETTGGTSIPTGSSARHPVSESLLESAARLEKSSTFHVGQFVGEVRKGVSDADTIVTTKNDKPLLGGITGSSSRSRMRGPSDEVWDVQSATSQETFKTADKEEGSSVDGGTTSTSQTPKNETAVARKVHKSLWAYVADIVRLGWIQRGESHDSNSNRPVKKSSSSNSRNTEGWLSSQERDNEGIQKKYESSRPQDQYLTKSHTGELLKKERLPISSQGLHTSEASNVTHIGTSKGDYVSRSSKDDAHMIGEKIKQSDVAASLKQDAVGGFSEDSTPTLEDITLGKFPEHEAVTSSMITTKGSADGDNGKEVIAGISSMPISTEGVGWTSGSDDKRNDPSGAMTPYHHPHTQVMMPHEDTSAVILEPPQLPTGGSTRFDEKTVLQEAPEVIRTEEKDAELKRRKFQRNKQVMKETFDEWEEAYQRDAEQRMTDELFMREALHEAQRAADIWEVPVGAVLVQNGEIIARGCNLVEDLRDSTAHAEIVCIREASNKLKTWRLADTTLYVTLEPCAMCAGAILQARVDTVVWGAPNKLLGADGSWVRLFPGDGQTSTLDSANTNQAAGPVHPFHPKISIRRGVLSNECSEIMQQFFHLRRKKKQKPESPPHAHLPGRNPVKFFSKMHHMFGTIFCM